LLVRQHVARPAHLADLWLSPAGIRARCQGRARFRGTTVYDEQRIFDRSAVIAVAIDARRQRFPEEAPYRYQPFAGLEDDFRWSPETYERVIRDYNTRDLGI